MTVKVFRSTDFGAPANTNAAGALIAILDACLVTGYGSQTATITRTDTTATVTLPVAHTLKSDTFVRISGANQADYNGDFAITVTGANTFTYQVANSPVTPATGTITSKVAPANWTKPFSGTNLAAYKQGAGSNGMYLRVSDTTTSLPRAKAFESMTDVNTGLGDFPTETQVAGGKYLPKSDSATAQDWIIIANEKLVFIMPRLNSNTIYPIAFGDIISVKSGDSFNTVFCGLSSQSDNTPVTLSPYANSTSEAGYLARNNLYLGGSVITGRYSFSMGQSIMGSGGIPYPSPIDNSLHLSEIYFTESAGIRGKMPGIWNVLHNKPFQHQDIVIGTGDFEGKKFMAFIGGWVNQAQWLIEISNTW